MNEQDLTTRKEMAEAHRRIQRFEGDIITRELDKDRVRRRSNSMSLAYYEQKCHEKEREIRRLKEKLNSRSWLERFLGIQRAS